MRELPNGLAVVEDFRRQSQTEAPSTFASRRLDMGDDAQRRRATAGSNDWQNEAWEYADEIEEVKFATGFRGALMKRLTLYAGAVVAPDQPAVPVDDAPDIPAEIAAAANAELDRLGTLDQKAELLGQWGAIATVSGESWLVGRDDPVASTGETWRLYSEANIVRGTDGRALAVRDRPMGKPADLNAATDVAVRIWRPHARWPDLADANMRSVLATCEELLIYARSLRAIGKSRTTANALYIANEIGDAPKADGTPTEMEKRWTQAMVTALTDDAAPASVVPFLFRGPAAFGQGQKAVPAKDAIFTIDLSRSSDEFVLERIEFLVKRLAHGLDVPVEALTGLSDVNHWTAWQIEDSTYKTHIEPDALTFATAITTELLRPALLDLFGPTALPFIRRIVAAINPAALVVRPNRSADALEAFDRWAISWRALRDHLSFGEDEAPDDEELLLRLTLQRSIGAATLTGPMLEETDLFPGAVDAMGDVAEAQAEGTATGAPPAVEPAQPTPDDTQPDAEAPAQAASAARARLRSLGTREENPRNPAPNSEVSDATFQVSASTLVNPHRNSLGNRGNPNGNSRNNGNLSTSSDRTAMAAALGERLGAIDRGLLDRLAMASSDALTNALRVIGNRLRSQAQGDPATAAVVKGVPAEQVAAALAAAGHPVPDVAPLAEDQFTQLGDHWTAWTAAAVASAGDAMLRAVPEPDEATTARVTQELDAGTGQSHAAGWAALSAALVTLAVRLTLDPTASIPDEGTDDLVRVPFGLIRHALGVAGGVTAPGAQPSGLAGEIGPGATVGMVASGPNASRALRAAGFTVRAWEWHHSFVTDPLRVHSDLHGVTFSDWHDEALANPGTFPLYSFLFPGDHLGCRCTTTAVLDPITEG